MKITFASLSKKKEKEKKTRKAIAKRFALHANAIVFKKHSISCYFRDNNLKFLVLNG